MTVIAGDRIELSRARTWLNPGPPRSGTSAGTLRAVAEPGDFLMDKTNGVAYFNEGTKASPYWTPVGYDQAPLFGVHTRFPGRSRRTDRGRDGEPSARGFRSSRLRPGDRGRRLRARRPSGRRGRPGRTDHHDQRGVSPPRGRDAGRRDAARPARPARPRRRAHERLRHHAPRDVHRLPRHGGRRARSGGYGRGDDRDLHPGRPRGAPLRRRLHRCRSDLRRPRQERRGRDLRTSRRLATRASTSRPPGHTSGSGSRSSPMAT